jgi:hypothetical protein
VSLPEGTLGQNYVMQNSGTKLCDVLKKYIFEKLTFDPVVNN